MGFLVLKSKNHDMSFVINKNPSTAPHVRIIRKGKCIGNFHKKEDETCYVLRFVDTEENVSFPRHRGDDYDYLPYKQYCAPILMTCIVKEMFGTIINKGSEKDIKTQCSLEQGIIKLSQKAKKLIEKMNTFITNYNIDIVNTNVKDLYRFKLSSESSTISELLQYAYLLGFTLNCMTFGYNEKPDPSALDKIIKIINNINAPYYIRYTLKNYMIQKKEFNRIKSALEGNYDSNSKSFKISMVYGNTQSQRCDFISEDLLGFCKNCIKFNNNIHIVDIGCGEGYYVKKLVNLLKSEGIKNVNYYAHDIDENEMKKISHLIKSDDTYSNVKPYMLIDNMIEDLSKLSDNDKIMIIFSEVIEHIPLIEVKEFMIKIISQINFKRMLITTPQSEFNIHYLLGDSGFRHHDHKQEFTRKQFEQFIKDVLDEVVEKCAKQLNSEYHTVGDCINDIGMSQAIILST